MKRDPRVPLEPGLDDRVLVGAVVVADDVELATRVGLGHQLQESKELLVAVLVIAGLGDPAGRTSNAANSVVVPFRL